MKMLNNTQKSKTENKIDVNGKKRGKGKIRINKRRLSVFFAIVAGIYIIYFISGPIGKLIDLQQEAQVLEQQKNKLEQENLSISENIELYKTDAYIEMKARENLGLIKPGEKLIIPYQEDDSVVTPTDSSTITEYQD